MTSADASTLVVVDTDVLLAATDLSRASHLAAMELLNGDGRRLAITPQIVREYLAAATRPTEVNGLGLPAADAVSNVELLLDDIELLREDAATTRLLLDLLGRESITGKQVHDASVVAVAVAHRAAAIVTDNSRHFTRFAELVAIEALTRQPRPMASDTPL